MQAEEIMAKRFSCAQIRIPEHVRVRFFVSAPDDPQKFKDVTTQVAKLRIDELDDAKGPCELLRFDKNDKLVWKTRHPSLQETKWYAEFEYGLPEDKWIQLPAPA